MMRVFICSILMIVMTCNAFSQQIDERILFIGEKPIVYSLDKKTSQVVNILEAFEKSHTQDLLLDNELLTKTLERLKSVEFTSTPLAVIVTGRTNQDMELLGDFDKSLLDCVNAIYQRGIKRVCLLQALNSMNARSIGAMFETAETANCVFVPMDASNPLQYSQELKKAIETPNVSASDNETTDGFILSDNIDLVSVPETTTSPTEMTAQNDAQNTNSLHLKMATPKGIKSFDSTDKVGITRRTIKKHLSVAR